MSAATETELSQAFATICQSPDPTGALSRMGDGMLAGLHIRIAASGFDSGIPAIVAGLIDREIVSRWIAGHTDAGEVHS